MLSAAYAKWRLLIRALPLVCVAVGVRAAMWRYDLGLVLPASSTTPVITACIFVAAQLMAGVLSDWKEAERMPSVLESALSSVVAAALVAAEHAHASPVPALEHVNAMLTAIVDYVDGTIPFAVASAAIVDAETGVCWLVGSVWRGEIRTVLPHVTVLKAALGRMETISATSFVPAAYALHDVVAAVVVACVACADLGGHGASTALLAFFAALFVYLSLLIRDLDSPFEYPPGMNRRCLDAGELIDRRLSETHASSVDLSLLTVHFGGLLRARRRAAAGASASPAGAGSGTSTTAGVHVSSASRGSCTCGGMVVA